MLYQKICAEKARLEKEIRKIDNKLKSFPKGKMYITRNGKYSKWYYSVNDKSKPIYIPKKKRQIAEQYAQKKYLLQMKSDLEQEKTALDFYIRHHKKRPWKSESFLEDKPEYQELLIPYFKPMSQELNEWVNAPYEKNPYKEENLKQPLENGQIVRSKSEVMISMILDKYHIPYRTECKLQVGNKICYPDFTVRHPQTGEYYYFEHLGLIEKYGYLENNIEKLHNYIMHGIIPMKNLIVTFETTEHPLTLEMVEWLVKSIIL